MFENIVENKNLVVVGVVMLVNALSYGTIIPLLYPYAARFGITATGLSLLFASFSLAQFFATPVIGRLSDKYGRKPLLLFSLLGTSISLAFFAGATALWQLFLARILDGITGGNISVAQAIIADTSQPSERSARFGILGALFGFGFALGPALGAFFSIFSLTAPFWFASGFALSGAILGYFLLSETNSSREKKRTTAMLSPMMLWSALTLPATGFVLWVSLFALIGNNAMIIGFQSFTVDVLSLDARAIGLLFTMFGIMNIIVQGFLLSTILRLHSSKKFLMRLSLSLSVAAILLTSFATTYWTFTVMILLFGAVFAPLNAIVTGLISERTNPEDQGGVLGINQALSSMAQIIGPLSAGIIVIYGTAWVFRLTGVILIIGLILTSGIAEKNMPRANL